MKSSTFRIPIYDQKVIVCIGGDDYESSKRISTFIGNEITNWQDSGGYTVANSCRIGVWLPESPSQGVIAHEAYHVVCRVWDNIGDKDFAEESTAYLLQWVVEKLTKAVKATGDAKQ